MRAALRHVLFLVACSCAATGTMSAKLALVCSSGSTPCGSVCVDPQSDTQNCGRCGNACTAGTTCHAGLCRYGPEPSVCVGQRVDLQKDRANCGTCGVTCASGQTCTEGRCVCVGPDSGTCAGVCVSLTTDVNHCGACGHACEAGGSCIEGRCHLRIASSASIGSIVAGNGNVYFYLGNGIVSVSRRGGTIVPLVVTPQPPPIVRSRAFGGLVLNRNHLYWLDPAAGVVMWAPSSGGSAAVFAANLGITKQMAVDDTNVYVLAQNAQYVDTLYAIPAGGGSPQALYSTRETIMSVATDGAHVYWGQRWGATDGTINELVGGTRMVLATGQREPTSLVVAGPTLVWSAGSAIMAARNGGLPAVLIAVYGSGFAVLGGWVYYGHDITHVSRVPLSGGPAEIVASGDWVTGVVTDGGSIYWTTRDALMRYDP
jgi:hypothetical protein